MAETATAGRNPIRKMTAGIGRSVISLVWPVVRLSSMTVAVVRQGCRPQNWRRTLADEFMRQCHSVGIGSLVFILLSGLLIGLAMVFQFLYWLGLVGRSGAVGDVIVLVMIREIAPLVVALIIVGRSGSVNMVEMGHLGTSGQLRLLDSQGIDPFLFFIVPRCLATAVSTFCLTIIFTFVTLVTGYLGGHLVKPSDVTFSAFVNQVLAAMDVGEYAILIFKPFSFGLIVTLITCTAGLSVDGVKRKLADVLPLGFVKSVLAVFLISGTLSVLL